MFDKVAPIVFVIFCVGVIILTAGLKIKEDYTRNQNCNQVCGNALIYKCSDDLTVCISKSDLQYHPK